MDTRRDFLKKSALLAAGSGVLGALPASIQRAFAIDPAPGSTYMDAEHVVILMQENRSFDHAYGCLRGVRGFNDPRARTLPNGNPVWLQSNAKGETYGPFQFDIKDTNVTWMGCLPHSRESQVAARNGGRHDHWIDAKASGSKAYAHLPLTMGHYNRQDIPFYYSLADAFTICDQNFCSVLACTTPNRLYLWTGTSHGVMDNDRVDLDHQANWMTFPERLEDAGVSWRVYQNEICLPTGFTEEEDNWLSNFGDNPLEYFSQYHVHFSAKRRETVTAELQHLEAQPVRDEKKIAKLQTELATWTEEAFAKLPEQERNLHTKAFTINDGDPDYRALQAMTYQDGAATRKINVPKGDVLHQFREDVQTGRLPAVSWIVAPERFSDHPSSPWYGAWYLSEAFDILTKNPAVWQKTIFILCYDENDGYFDHIPPFMPPHPDHPETGKVSVGIDTAIEHAKGDPDAIGLGYRVPLVIASPWSRGGYVCSEVFDHTSILRFLEKFLSQKTGKTIRETNITDWRRAICGDLTSAFRTYHGEKVELPEPVNREEFLDTISRAKFRPEPTGFKIWSAEEIAAIGRQQGRAPWLPRQEPGIRPACALPYELAADAVLGADRKALVIRMAAGNKRFGAASAGAPFQLYAQQSGRTWNYSVCAGDQLEDGVALADFPNGTYNLQLYGPNGFYREFRGSASDPLVEVTVQGDGRLHLVNRDPHRELRLLVENKTYGSPARAMTIPPGGSAQGDVSQSGGWHDILIRVEGYPDYARRYAGRIETGVESTTDPQMA